MLHAKRSLALVTLMILFSVGCNSPDTISKFCAASNATLASAVPVFQDIKGFCLRQKNIAKGIGTFEIVTDDEGCNDLGKQADGAVAAVQILADYFTAINALANFGTAKAGSDAGTLVEKTAAAVGANTAAQTALGSIASFLTSVATSGYQRKSLNNDIIAANKNIGDVIDALVMILRENYIKQGLDQESKNLASRYKEFSLAHNDGALILQLDDRWHSDAQAVADKRVAAENLIEALLAIKKGVADLAANAKKINTKELAALLEPYVTQLETLIPQVQKAF
jgi:hypothetical protein